MFEFVAVWAMFAIIFFAGWASRVLVEKFQRRMKKRQLVLRRQFYYRTRAGDGPYEW